LNNFAALLPVPSDSRTIFFGAAFGFVFSGMDAPTPKYRLSRKFARNCE
jgi:hypothetical protein